MDADNLRRAILSRFGEDVDRRAGLARRRVGLVEQAAVLDFLDRRGMVPKLGGLDRRRVGESAAGRSSFISPG